MYNPYYSDTGNKKIFKNPQRFLKRKKYTLDRREREGLLGAVLTYQDKAKRFEETETSVPWNSHICMSFFPPQHHSQLEATQWLDHDSKLNQNWFSLFCRIPGTSKSTLRSGTLGTPCGAIQSLSVALALWLGVLGRKVWQKGHLYCIPGKHCSKQSYVEV